MPKDLTQFYKAKTLTGLSNISDFEVLEEYSLLIALTNSLGRVEVFNMKTLKCLRVLNFHTTNITSYHFNKLVVHKSSVTFCSLQAPKLFQSNVFVGNFRKNHGFSIPFEYSNSTKTIALMQDVLITAGVSSRIRFWDIHNGSFVDEICFPQNSTCITNITPVEEKYMLICAEETTSSLWLVSLQSKKLLRSIPLDGGQNAITTLCNGKLACLSHSKKLLSFWSILQKGFEKYDLQMLNKISLDCSGNFLLISKDNGAKQDLIAYATIDGVKFKDPSTHQTVGIMTINLREKKLKKLPMRLFEIRGNAKQSRMMLLHDGTKISAISVSEEFFNFGFESDE